MAAAAGAGAGHHLKGQGSADRPELKSRDRPNLEPARGCCLSILAQGSNQNFCWLDWAGCSLSVTCWATAGGPDALITARRAAASERGCLCPLPSGVSVASDSVPWHAQAPQTRSRHAGPGKSSRRQCACPPPRTRPGSFGQPVPRRQARAFSVRGALTLCIDWRWKTRRSH